MTMATDTVLVMWMLCLHASHHFLSNFCCVCKVFAVYFEKGRSSKEIAMIAIFIPEDISSTPFHSVIC